MKPNSS